MSEDKLHNVQIKNTGNRTRVLVDGIDVSKFCYEIELRQDNPIYADVTLFVKAKLDVETRALANQEEIET